MVSMVAFQAVDPGSIPGHRILKCQLHEKLGKLVYSSQNKHSFYMTNSKMYLLHTRLVQGKMFPMYNHSCFITNELDGYLN